MQLEDLNRIKGKCLQAGCSDDHSKPTMLFEVSMIDLKEFPTNPLYREFVILTREQFYQAIKPLLDDHERRIFKTPEPPAS